MNKRLHTKADQARLRDQARLPEVEEVDVVVHFAGEGGEEEKAAFQDAPSWARFLYKDIKQKRGELTQLKSKFVSHKAVVNQKLGEYEKSAEHISERFDEFDAIKETMCMDMDSLFEGGERLDEKLTRIMNKLDDIEQYSRRNKLGACTLQKISSNFD